MKIIRLSTSLNQNEVNALHTHGFEQILDLRVNQRGHGPRPIEETLFLTLRRAMIGYEQDAELSQSIVEGQGVQHNEWQTLLLCLERAEKSILILADAPAALIPAIQIRLGADAEVGLWNALTQSESLAA